MGGQRASGYNWRALFEADIGRYKRGLYVPESGRVLIDGIDLALRDPAWLRRQIGVVLRENVDMPATLDAAVATCRCRSARDLA
jgi:hypothetical protein